MTESLAVPKKRLLVTGWSGFVAGSVIAQGLSDWELYGVGRSEPPADTRSVRYHRLDLLEPEKVRKIFAEINPDAVIHSAAIADIDFCQNNQAIAEKTNVETTATLVELCKENNSKFVFCSTDNFFDGKDRLYTEDSVPKPVNFYGETKVRAEQTVCELNTQGVVARLALVIGLPVIGRGNSFLSGAIEKWKNGRTGEYPDNEIRTPIDVITLGKSLLELAGNDFSGIMHLAGNTRINRCEMAQFIAKKIGYSSALINSVDSNGIDGRASRPNDVSLDNSKARDVLQTPMQSLEEGLHLTLSFRAP